MPDVSNLDDAVTSRMTILEAYAQLDPARRADLAEHAARLLEQQEGEQQ